MESLITCDDFIKTILEHAEGKFITELQSETANKLLLLAPDRLDKTAVLRLKRSTGNSNYWRTFIICICNNFNDVSSVLRWSADVKSELVDPENADLYLISASHANDLSFEQCIQIESGEQFCRKYILRPGEHTIDLINRTFLGSMSESGSANELTDPLQAALVATGSEKTWFDTLARKQWYNAFFSGETGEGLINELFMNHSNNNMSDEKTE